MIPLNESQQRAALHRDGPMRVLAGPGSGKTAVIIERALRLLRDGRVPARRILIITYSKAAAEEMRKRFAAAAPDERVTFGTFHAVFFRMLRQSSGLTLEQVCKENERRDSVKGMLSAMGYALDDESLAAVLNEMSMVKNELIDLRHYHAAAMGSEDFAALCGQYETYKKNANKIDFDDMLTLCHEMFSRDAVALDAWRRRYPYIMVDEFQDINRVQYETVKLLAAPENNLFVVGDDDQSIYRFRGSRPEFLLHFTADYPDARQEVLEVNYRSSEAVISFANTLIADNRVRFKKAVSGTGKAGGDPVRLAADDVNQEAARIAEMVKARLKKGEDPDGMAVIYRLNIQSRALGDAFLHTNIPFKVRDEAPIIYEHWIAQDLLAYLRLGQGRPKGYDPDAWRVINKPYRFIGKAFLASAKKANVHLFDAFAADPTLHTAQKNRLYELLADVQALRKKKTAAAIRHIRRAVGYDDYIREHCAYRKIDPAGLLEIADEIQDAAKPYPDAEGFMAHIAETVQRAKAQKDSLGPSVTLTTMHSAKGLEFDTVFIAGAADGVIPYERSKTGTEIEEERRLLYVAVTRARQNLYISVPATRYDKALKPSRFLV